MIIVQARMMSPSSEIALEVWQAEARTPRIEYSRAVVEEIGIAATAGFNRMAHGGVEVGGVLFGIRNSDSLEILAHRALTCEYAFGPSFTLSENDGRALEDLLASAASDPELAGMQAVGWYHSHTRSEILLSKKDLELYQRYFPESWQIALVLRPFRFDPVRAGFFFREPDGSVRADATRHEFLIQPPRRKPVARLEADAEPVDQRPPDAPARAGTVAATQMALQHLPVQAAPVREPEPEKIEFAVAGAPARELEPARPAWWAGKVRWVWRAASIALVAITALYWIVNLRSAAGLSLRATDNAGQLRIEWNCDSRVARNGLSGALEIEDGPLKVRSELSKDQLGAGSVTYMRNSGNVLVRLVVRGPDEATMTETARFLGSPVRVEQMHAAGTIPRVSEPPAIEARVSVRHEVVSSLPRPAGKEPSIRGLDPTAQGSRSESRDRMETSPLTFDVPSTPARHFVSPPANVERSRGVDVATPPVPSAAINIAPTLPVATNMAPALPDLLPRLAAPELPKPVYRGPLEGKIIWTGKLARHGVIQIEGKHVSQGYLTGALPGVPVRVQVFPAEFTPAGLRIFTANSRDTHATEAPGAFNGWNRTTYVLSPAQADKLKVIEAPGPQNAWNRVKLRAESGEHSIIVLSWELTPPGASAQAASDR